MGKKERIKTVVLVEEEGEGEMVVVGGGHGGRGCGVVGEMKRG